MLACASLANARTDIRRELSRRGMDRYVTLVSDKVLLQRIERGGLLMCQAQGPILAGVSYGLIVED